ncbi:MAG: reverse transcriptase domain-containing protein [Solirubrobacteraceae bacterium]|jgi:group II intron reverse transcriptase/maturase
MQNAETVLDVLRERGRKGLPLEGIYRQLFNPQLYLLAYGRIYSNKGAMTSGPDAETADGMTMGKIERIIDAVRHERYRFRPVRRRYIPKKDGKQRPLGLPSWSDKLLGEVIRLLLEAYYEPQFSDHSHGYRPGRGCHSALGEVARTWTGTSWFIEGDISQCFDRLDHRVMLETLGEKVHDNRLLRLVGQMLAAGYLEDWVWNATLSGAPQGGVLSPCLSNIYLDRLDCFVETILMPGYNRGVLRKHNPEYRRVQYALAKARVRGDHVTVRALRKQQRGLPSHDPNDPGYRRLRYVRYADDILLGFTGPKAEAEEIKRQLAQFLHENLKLELSETKTLMTHASTNVARFLGYEITVQRDNRKQTASRRSVNGQIRLRVPMDVIRAKCSRYTKRGQPASRTEMMNEGDHVIINRYGAEYRGIVQYYLLAGDVYRLDRLHWVMQTSLLKTLAGKYDSTVTKMAGRYKATIETAHGPHKCLQVSVDRGKDRKPLVATFGGIPLRRQKHAFLHDRVPVPVTGPRKELITRLLKGRCELCGQLDEVQVHQTRKLADLDKPGPPQPEWAQIMAKRRRKTLVVCSRCHASIHPRTATPSITEQSLESPVS